MTGFESVFIDTAPVIYYLQGNELYYSKMKRFWQDYEGYDYITSTVTIMEYLTYPYKRNDLNMVSDFYSFIDGMEIMVGQIDRTIAEKAARIRAEYPAFKTMDALQLATACIYGCDLFLTNDKQLRQFREIRCVTVDDL